MDTAVILTSESCLAAGSGPLAENRGREQSTARKCIMVGGGVCSGDSGGSVECSDTWNGDTTSSGCECGDEDDCCCQLCCCLFCCAFCCSKQPVSRKLLVSTLTFWTVVFMLSGFALKYARYDTASFDLAIGDERIVDKGVSPFLCQSVDVSTSGMLPFTLWYLNETPMVDKSQFRKQTFTGTESVPSNEYRYYAFYYLAGTEVDLQLCAYSQGTFLLIKGESNRDAYKDSSSCYSCYETNALFQPGGCGESMPWGFRYRYTVSTSDYYYHVVAMPDGSSSTVEYIFTMNRREFNLPAHGDLVEHTKVDFTSWTEGVIVVAFNSSTGSSATFNTVCNTRVTPYVIFFLAIPIAMLVFVYVTLIAIRSGCCRAKEVVDVLTPLLSTSNTSAYQPI